MRTTLSVFNINTTYFIWWTDKNDASIFFFFEKIKFWQCSCCKRAESQLLIKRGLFEYVLIQLMNFRISWTATLQIISEKLPLLRNFEQTFELTCSWNYLFSYFETYVQFSELFAWYCIVSKPTLLILLFSYYISKTFFTS